MADKNTTYTWAIILALLPVVFSAQIETVLKGLVALFTRTEFGDVHPDITLVSLLISFIAGLVYLLHKNRNDNAVGHVAIFGGIIALLVTAVLTALKTKCVPLEGFLHVAFIASVAGILVTVTLALVKPVVRDRYLPRIWAILCFTFAISILIGFALQGIMEVIWRSLIAARQGDNSSGKFFVAPSAIIIGTVVWGSMTLIPVYHKIDNSLSRKDSIVWAGLLLSLAILLSYTYGVTFLHGYPDPKKWVSCVSPARTSSGWLGVGMLIPGLLSTVLITTLGSKLKEIQAYLIGCMLAATIAGVTAYWVSRFIQCEYPEIQPGTDVTLFVMFHVVSAVAVFITIRCCMVYSQRYPWKWLDLFSTKS